MEFSKKLLVFASAMFMATWTVIVVTIFVDVEVPWELIETLSWVYGAAVACYCGKTAYENKPKIEKGMEVMANEHGRQDAP